jgi:hypothetical protein
MEGVMQMNESRRRFLTTLGSVSAIGIVGTSTSIAQEASDWRFFNELKRELKD